MKPELKEYLNAINKTGEGLMDYDVSCDNAKNYEKSYPAFIINRILSGFEDCIFHVNELNIYSNITNKQKFDYLRIGLAKRNRFSPWIKENTNDDINLICRSMGVNKQRALEYLQMMNKEDIDKIRKKMNTGGLSDKQRKLVNR